MCYTFGMKSDGKYISVAECAVKFGISERSVRNYCAKGKIADAKLVGKTWYIPVDAVKPSRQARFDQMPRSVGGLLKMEMSVGLKGGLYHQLQIDFTYNSNHIEGSRLTHEQTRWIFETHTIGALPPEIRIDDVFETANHFRCIDRVISSYGAALSESYIKELHRILKTGTTDAAKPWFAVGDYKKLENMVGDMETCPVKSVHSEMRKLISRYNQSQKAFEDIVDFHACFEQIHPFQDGNGRVGRLVMLKECLKHGYTPFVISERIKQFYYLGLQDWHAGYHERLLDTCRSGQDAFNLLLKKLGHGKMVREE